MTMSQEEMWAEVEARGPHDKWVQQHTRRYKFRMSSVLDTWSRPSFSYTCLLFVTKQGQAALIFPGRPATVRYYPDETTARVAMEMRT